MCWVLCVLRVLYVIITYARVLRGFALPEKGAERFDGPGKL